jgi:O-antigen/teichoic acid export membrane protein
MAKLGAAFMLGGLATSATLLLVRGRISQELGLDAAGYFAAAWGITMTYVGFLLGAMAADYYPRLTEVIHDKVAAVRLMNDQAQLGLAIGGPVLLLLIGLVPWVIILFYSKEFSPAATLIQWQTLGNVFKIAGWSLGFAHVAAGRSTVFLFNQLAWNFIFLLITWPGLTSLGIAITGPAFVVAYGLGLIINIALVRHFLDFRWQVLSLGLLGLHSGLSLSLIMIAFIAPLLAAALSIPLALTTGLIGLRIVLSKIGNQGRLPTRLYGIFERLGWPIQSAG